jgi:hypothetical protein
MPARRKPAVRITALVLAFGANASLFLLLWLSRSGDSPEAVAPAMIWISMSQARPEAIPPPLPPDRVEPRAPITATVPAPVVIAPPSQPGTAITLPPIDWYAEGQRAARNAFPDNAKLSPEGSLDSAPKAMELPDLSNRPHQRGDTEHFEGGESITWLDERCYITNRPVPPPTMAGEFQMQRPVCKVRSMKARQREKDAAALKEAGDPVEKPQPSNSSNPFPNLP